MPLLKLTPEQLDAVWPLAGAAPPLYCAGVLAGKYPGVVLADRAEGPRSAWLIKELWCHLLGDPANAPFVAAVRRALAEKHHLGAETNVLFFVDPAAAWLTALEGAVPGRQWIEMPRVLYVAEAATPLLAPAPPPDVELWPIDAALPGRVSGELPGDVQKVLALRQAAARPDDQAFGVVALADGACAAWAVVDWIVGERAEIRLVTAPAYRRRGLALAVSAAALAHGLRGGLREIHWDAAAANTGSLRTAARLGLRRRRTGCEYLLIYPETGYLINLAWSHLDAGRYKAVRKVAGEMLARDQEVLTRYGHFLAGSAWAGEGEPAQAIAALHQALDAGFDDWEAVEDSPVLGRLSDAAAWKALQLRIAARRAAA